MSPNSIHSQPLPKPQRTQLENTVKAAREVAEKGARAALAQLAVAEGRAPDYLSDDHKALRRRLRAHGRALGDAKADDDTQAVPGAWLRAGSDPSRVPPAAARTRFVSDPCRIRATRA